MTRRTESNPSFERDIAVLYRNDKKNGQVFVELKVFGVPAIALHLDVTERETPGEAVPVPGV